MVENAVNFNFLRFVMHSHNSSLIGMRTILGRNWKGTHSFLKPFQSRLHKFQSVRAGIATYNKPFFENEPSPTYSKGSPERAALTEALRNLKSKLPVKIPLAIAGKSIFDNTSGKQLNPSEHQQVVARWVPANKNHVEEAIEAALAAKPAWEALSFEDRAAIFLRSAELVTGKYRYEIVAATMLGQGKNIWQAEIDAAAEVADFMRCYVQAGMDLLAQQPAVNSPGTWNRLEYRALEGFVYAISPFNFTALGANLVLGPALMGNVVIWKPSLYALHASWILYKILLEAGLPENVIQFVPGDAEEITDTVFKSRHFSALNFTGSTQVFKSLLGKIGVATAQDTYLSYPRVVGETGGKNFHIVHQSADVESAVNNTVRGIVEYQGQKCSATSRIYVARSIWPEFKKRIIAKFEKIKVGGVENYENLVNAVIHEEAFDRLADVIENARSDTSLTLLAGGKASKEDGFFVYPTIYETNNPNHELLKKELFGPIGIFYVFNDNEWNETLKLVDSTSAYGLTGSVFALDQKALHEAEIALRHSAGNFYINTKSTGSVVAQQPFGGSRGSGTNDKSGTTNLLIRFSSIRAIKEDFSRLSDIEYPSNDI
ncbi:delta-1-pyrroline-5-carboxylate dehydrogenase [Bisporella sp. PMI_857]|nr:delta-1-pyrroline-5-carboxylate dehydrogenase [Bisporella sp. PMI_857]